jgi:hypothetical protein
MKTAHFHPATCNLAHWLSIHGSPTIHRCFTLPQLLYRWRHQSGIFWIVVLYLPKPANWRTTPCRLSTTAYSMCSQLSSISIGRSPHPQPEGAPCRGDVDPLIMKYICNEKQIYRVIKTSLCTWWLKYRTLNYCSKCPPPVSRHLLTRRTVFSKTVFVQHGPHSECFLWWPSSNHQLCEDCSNTLSFSSHPRKKNQVNRDFLITLY